LQLAAVGLLLAADLGALEEAAGRRPIAASRQRTFLEA
jgi:hypothetical protein